MKIALVSEGPSARAFPGGAGYDHVVGVNTVPTRWPCDWWVFADPDIYVCEGPSILGRPKMLTTSSLERAMNEKRFQAAGLETRYREDRAAHRIYTEEEMPLLPAMPRDVPILEAGNRRGQPRWFNYSGLGALVCCWFLGQGVLEPTRDPVRTEVDVYGVDLQGIGDVNGKNGIGRTEGRWERERCIWDGLIRGLERTGLMTVHWTPPEERHGETDAK